MGGRERRTGEGAKGGEGREAARRWKEGRERARIFAVAPERMVTRRRQPLNATATSGGDRGGGRRGGVGTDQSSKMPQQDGAAADPRRVNSEEVGKLVGICTHFRY